MKWLIARVLAFILVSCSTASPQPGESTLQAITPGYPAAVQRADIGTAYPVATQVSTASAADNTISPTIDPSLGLVKGRLLENGKAVENIDLYLANLLKNEAGEEVVFTFDRTISLRTKTNENGEFVFINIPFGSYGIVLDNVSESVLLLNPLTNDQLKLVIQSGNELDLGNLNFSELPTD